MLLPRLWGMRGLVKLHGMKLLTMLQALSNIQAQRANLRIYMKRLNYWNVVMLERGVITHDEALMRKSERYNSF